MRIPPIEAFREQAGGRYGAAWGGDPEDASFTLMLPDGEPVEVEGGWEGRPHEASYEMARVVVPQADALLAEAVAFLDGIVAFDKLAMQGEPFVIGIHCNAAMQRVILELEWTAELTCRFSVTFSWRMNHPQLPDHRTPVAMAFWAR